VLYVNLGKETINNLKKMSVDLLDLSGQVVKSIAVNANLLEIQCGSIAKGSYFLRITGQDEVSTVKITIQ
jgi:hypothetical protein